jgi:hypothetical protein
MYIKDLCAISPQATLDDSFFGNDARVFEGNYYLIEEPDYTDLIPRGLLRRMGKASRIGVKVGLTLLKKNPEVEGIILGTGDGGIEDSLKFVGQIIEYDEGTLTPTNFVQSTPNSLAGTLALMSKNTGYNNTYVDKGLAFEACILDAQLLLAEGEAKSLLIGNVEQFYIQSYNIEFQDGLYKLEETASDKLLNSNTDGTVAGEGCAMFVVDDDRQNALAELVDVAQITYPTRQELDEELNNFLTTNGLSVSDVEALVLGYNGDQRDDHLYDEMRACFDSNTSTYTFKNLCGEYATVTAFATYFAAGILQGKQVPKMCCIANSDKPIKNLLIYNHYRGRLHGFILMKAV